MKNEKLEKKNDAGRKQSTNEILCSEKLGYGFATLSLALATRVLARPRKHGRPILKVKSLINFYFKKLSLFIKESLQRGQKHGKRLQEKAILNPNSSIVRKSPTVNSNLNHVLDRFALQKRLQARFRLETSNRRLLNGQER